MPPPFGAGAQVLDALYRPVRSSHEPLQRLSCPSAAFRGLECYRTVSHLLGIKRAVLLKMEEEELVQSALLPV